MEEWHEEAELEKKRSASYLTKDITPETPFSARLEDESTYRAFQRKILVRYQPE